MWKLKNTDKCIKGVVFDMDGTLCLPQTWMFKDMRDAIGCQDPKIDILTFIEELPTAEEQAEAERKITVVEKKAMEEMEPQPGMIELFRFLKENRISKSICTRNLIGAVTYLVESFVPTDLNDFECIVTREFYPPKPKPDPLLHISKQLKLKPEEMIMVGDSADDMKSGAAAGFTTILLNNDVNKLLRDDKKLVTYSVDKLSDIIDLLEPL
ncbi:hypothetical protein C6P41_003113 [Kluyveromyces marxianus]|nr:hypothetical protein C6P43_002355 [Kluyveromyces marxianus]KAG0685824.1 hypothetical protein C6P41_003113 [Kluyveromyces marxianus]